MAFRFDDVSFATRTEERADGLYAYSTVCRDGILTYFRGDGKRVRELRPASANRDRDFLEALKDLPMTVEHPSSLLRGKRDSSIGELTRAGEYNDAEGVVQNIARISNPDFAQSVKAGKKNGLSLGYECEIVEAPNGEWFDAIDQITYRGDFDRVQTKIRPDHCAATDNPRGGSDVRMHLDSADTDEDSVVGLVRFDSIQVESSAPNSVVVIPKIKDEGSFAMSDLKTKTLRVDGAGEFQVEDVALYPLSQKLEELSKYKARVDSLEAELKEKSAAVDDLTSEVNRAKGRADALEDELTETLTELETVRQDASCKGKDSEDEEDDEESDDEMPDFIKKKMKAKKAKGEKMDASDLAIVLDSDEVKEFLANEINNQTADRLDAIGKAHELLSAKGINIEDAGIETTMDSTEIRRAALKAIHPDVDLSDRNDSYIEARFDSAAEYAAQAPVLSPADRLETAVKVGRTERKDSTEEKKDAAAVNNERYGKNYAKPLTRSNKK
jgi:hypothetical protein